VERFLEESVSSSHQLPFKAVHKSQNSIRARTLMLFVPPSLGRRPLEAVAGKQPLIFPRGNMSVGKSTNPTVTRQWEGCSWYLCKEIAILSTWTGLVPELLPEGSSSGWNHSRKGSSHGLTKDSRKRVSAWKEDVNRV